MMQDTLQSAKQDLENKNYFELSRQLKAWAETYAKDTSEENVVKTLECLVFEEKLLKAHLNNLGKDINSPQKKEIETRIQELVAEKSRAIESYAQKVLMVESTIALTQMTEELTNLQQMLFSLQNTVWIEDDKLLTQAILRTKNSELRGFVRSLFEFCLQMTNFPKEEFVFMSIGSLSNELATPFSDLEYVVVISKDDDSLREHLKLHTRLVSLIILCLGQTPLNAIKERVLETDLSKYVGLVSQGMRLDTVKVPDSKNYQYSLINTPDNFFSEENKWLHRPKNHTTSALLTARFLMGYEKEKLVYRSTESSLIRNYYQARDAYLERSLKQHIEKSVSSELLHSILCQELANLDSLSTKLDNYLTLGNEDWAKQSDIKELIIPVRELVYGIPLLDKQRNPHLKQITGRGIWSLMKELHRISVNEIKLEPFVDDVKEYLLTVLTLRYNHQFTHKQAKAIIAMLPEDMKDRLQEIKTQGTNLMGKIKEIYAKFVHFPMPSQFVESDDSEIEESSVISITISSSNENSLSNDRINHLTVVSKKIIYNFNLTNSDFKNLFLHINQFVDKTLFIKELENSAHSIEIILRPRRFFKTTLLSMLKYFYGAPEERALFTHQERKMKIAEYQAIVNEHQGQHPVIHIDFGDFGAINWSDALEDLKEKISEIYNSVSKEMSEKWISERALNEPNNRKFIVENIQNKVAHNSAFKQAIKTLIEYIYQMTGKTVVILIDEYDKPFEVAALNDFLPEMLSFMRVFYTCWTTDCKNIHKAIICGFVHLEEIDFFSSTKFGICSILTDKKYLPYFGLTKEEVKDLLDRNGINKDRLETLEYEYGSYQFDGKFIFNPYSVINFINEAKKKGESSIASTFWIESAESKRIATYFDSLEIDKKISIENISSLISPLKENFSEYTSLLKVTFADLEKNLNTLWSFLLHSGYLAVRYFGNIKEDNKCELYIPNREIYTFYQQFFNDSRFNPDKLPCPPFLTADDKILALLENQDEARIEKGLYWIEQLDELKDKLFSATLRLMINDGMIKNRERIRECVWRIFLRFDYVAKLRVFETLIKMLTSSFTDTLQFAKNKLKVLGKLETLEVNAQHIDNLKSNVLVRIEFSFHALRETGKLMEPEVIQIYIENLISSSAEEKIKTFIIDSLSSLRGNEVVKTLEIIKKNLLSSELFIRDTISRALVAVTNKADMVEEEFMATYEEGLRSHDSGVKTTILTLLERLKHYHEKIFNILLFLLKDKDEKIRSHASKLLKTCHNEGCDQKVFNILEEIIRNEEYDSNCKLFALKTLNDDMELGKANSEDNLKITTLFLDCFKMLKNGNMKIVCLKYLFEICIKQKDFEIKNKFIIELHSILQNRNKVVDSKIGLSTFNKLISRLITSASTDSIVAKPWGFCYLQELIFEHETFDIDFQAYLNESDLSNDNQEIIIDFLLIVLKFDEGMRNKPREWILKFLGKQLKFSENDKIHKKIISNLKISIQSKIIHISTELEKELIEIFITKLRHYNSRIRQDAVEVILLLEGAKEPLVIKALLENIVDGQVGIRQSAYVALTKLSIVLGKITSEESQEVVNSIVSEIDEPTKIITMLLFFNHNPTFSRILNEKLIGNIEKQAPLLAFKYSSEETSITSEAVSTGEIAQAETKKKGAAYYYKGKSKDNVGNVNKAKEYFLQAQTFFKTEIAKQKDEKTDRRLEKISDYLEKHNI